MRIITETRLRIAAAKHPNVASTIYRWIKTVRKAQWKTLVDTRRTFPHADQIKASEKLLTVFNLGDDYRLIAAIHYNRNRIYIRRVLTHAEYSKDRWKNNP